MYNEIAERFLLELKERRSLRIIVSDSSEEEENDKVQKRKRGRPQKERLKEETIDDILKMSLSSNIAVQEIVIAGLKYNKCIYTNDLYDDSGSKVGKYSITSHSIEKY